MHLRRGRRVCRHPIRPDRELGLGRGRAGVCLTLRVQSQSGYMIRRNPDVLVFLNQIRSRVRFRVRFELDLDFAAATTIELCVFT